jgi:hypothetical protein
VQCKNYSNGCTTELPAGEMVHHQHMCKIDTVAEVGICQSLLALSCCKDQPSPLGDKNTLVESNQPQTPNADFFWKTFVPKRAIKDVSIPLDTLFLEKTPVDIYASQYKPLLKYREDGFVRPKSYGVSVLVLIISYQTDALFLNTSVSSHYSNDTT